ncbi:MAG: hypothetical protein LBI78_04020 [Campylobacteraceae bacterium]|jgi:thioredoxin-related protein|nr:hypothetical protein [Campylobacteraceae bacterium]
MKIVNIIMVLAIVLFGLSGCSPYVTTQSYELFEENKNLTIGGSHIPNMNKQRREIYSEDKYIYIFETPPKCIFGYLTNRDEKEEKIIGWVILSGEEFCKQQTHRYYLTKDIWKLPN